MGINSKLLQIADLFCGAGGSTTGIRQAVDRMGRKASILAINHWEVAIQTHSTNNNGVEHLCESVDHIDPTKVVPGQELDLLWASPACTHHSIARGGRPRCEQQRAPAWIIPFWLENLKVKRLIIENVPEFQSWGPLDDDGKPVKESKGETFKAFIAAIRSLGYTVERQVLNAANYGDPTVRRRLFIQAIKGIGKQIKWPNITHAEKQFNMNGLPKWIPARDIIDSNLHGESIFKRKRPLAPATLRRIEHGIKKFWQPHAEPFLIVLRETSKSRSLDKPLPTVTASGAHYAIIEPFILPNEGYYRGNKPRSIDDPLSTITSRGGGAIIEPFLSCFHGGDGSEVRNHSINDPLPVIDTSNRYAIVEPFITAIGQSSARDRSHSLDEPLPTVVTKQEHVLIEPFLINYYGNGTAYSIDIPLGTATTKDRFALIEPGGEFSLDIRFRMLQPHELAAAQGFHGDYKFCGTKTDITKQIGNAVPVNLSRELAYCCLMTEVA
jgi:DNA (cytosine-5)-methyltransferase 1